MQFVVYAHDYPDAWERRLEVRESHLEGVRRMKSEGSFVLGGALLDDAGGMVGSMMLVEFPRRGGGPGVARGRDLHDGAGMEDRGRPSVPPSPRLISP